ncbi:MAG: hypothetical protein OEV31_08065, partial [Gammaproteobacteria bacterium]|nr:hypothetical protein [Gammaproteobacteria bacterium]
MRKRKFPESAGVAIFRLNFQSVEVSFCNYSGSEVGMSKIIRKSLLFAVATAVGFSSLAFQAGMSADAVQAEVQQRLQRGESLDAIASAANSAGISASVLTVALIAQGQNASAVVAALVRNGMPANAVVNAAVSAGQDFNTMV